MVVAAPAREAGIGSHAAGVTDADGHRSERARWRSRLTKEVAAPAGDLVVGPHATGVKGPLLTDRKVRHFCVRGGVSMALAKTVVSCR